MSDLSRRTLRALLTLSMAMFALIPTACCGARQFAAGVPVKVEVDSSVPTDTDFSVDVELASISSPTWIDLEWSPESNLSVAPRKHLARSRTFTVPARTAASLGTSGGQTTVRVYSGGGSKADTFSVVERQVAGGPGPKAAGVPVKVEMPAFVGPNEDFEVEIEFEGWSSPGGWFSLELLPANAFATGGGRNDHLANAPTVRVPARTNSLSTVNDFSVSVGIARAGGETEAGLMILVRDLSQVQPWVTMLQGIKAAGVPVKVQGPPSAAEGHDVAVVIGLDYEGESDVTPITVNLEYLTPSDWVSRQPSALVDGPLVDGWRHKVVLLRLANPPDGAQRQSVITAWHDSRGVRKEDTHTVTVQPSP